MESAEIEALIDEFEQRVERLRALYDQYFMGLEKIEPAVLRKDVDRRLWVLRREQIRNTGLRFKLNTIVQRYNTYQQYWMRICREIENGTYKRDLRRAAKRFGTEALTVQARKRLGKQAQRELEEEQAQERKRQESESFDVDVDVELEEEPEAAPPPPPRRKPPVHVLSLDALDNLEDILGLSEPAGMAAAPPAPRSASPSFGGLGGIFGEDEGDQLRPQPPAPGVRTAPPPPRPAAGVPQRAAAPAQPLPPLPPRRPLPAPQQPPPSAQPPASSAGLGLARKTPPAAPVAAPPMQRPPAALASPNPLPTRPVSPATPPPQRPPPTATPRPPAALDASISDARVREIYAKYVQAKRECRESTSGITEDNLTRSLRATAEKLKSQHKGRQVDFDVVIKDGKAVLKPVVKG